MTRPTRIEMNCTTGVQSVIELTDEELEQLNKLSEFQELAQEKAFEKVFM